MATRRTSGLPLRVRAGKIAKALKVGLSVTVSNGSGDANAGLTGTITAFVTNGYPTATVDCSGAGGSSATYALPLLRTA